MTSRLTISGFVLVAGLSVAACGSPSTDPADPDVGAIVVDARAGQTFELGPGEIARIEGLGILVGFRGVASDSRCPTDVTCVWAGDAAVRIRATVGRAEWTPFDLHTNLDPRIASIGGHTISVVGLTPEPVSGSTIASGRYRVTLRVE
jgi:hypothetical protein